MRMTPHSVPFAGTAALLMAVIAALVISAAPLSAADIAPPPPAPTPPPATQQTTYTVVLKNAKAAEVVKNLADLAKNPNSTTPRPDSLGGGSGPNDQMLEVLAHSTFTPNVEANSVTISTTIMYEASTRGLMIQQDFAAVKISTDIVLLEVPADLLLNPKTLEVTKLKGLPGVKVYVRPSSIEVSNTTIHVTGGDLPPPANPGEAPIFTGVAFSLRPESASNGMHYTIQSLVDGYSALPAGKWQFPLGETPEFPGDGHLKLTLAGVAANGQQVVFDAGPATTPGRKNVAVIVFKNLGDIPTTAKPAATAVASAPGDSAAAPATSNAR